MTSLTRSLRWRLGLTLSLGVLALLSLTLMGAYLILRANVLQTGIAQQLAQQQRIAAGLDEVFASIERRTQEFALQIVTAKPNPDQLIAMMQSRVLKDPDTASIGTLLEAINPVNPMGRFAVVATYSNRGLQFTDFVQTGYAYWTKDWYTQTLAKQGGWWSDPYFNDAAGGQDTVTLDYPLRDERGNLFGMTGISVTVDRVIELAEAQGLRIHDPARHAITDARGKLLLSWDPALERAYTVAQAAERTGSQALSLLAKVDRHAEATVVGVDDGLQGREYLAYAAVPRVGWRVASIVSEAELLAPLHDSIRRVGLLTLVLVIGVLPLAFLLARRVAEPLRRLLASTEALAQGQLHAAATLPAGRSEIGQLAVAVSQVAQRLASETQRADHASADEQRSRIDWQQAAQSQRSVLPADRIFFGPRLQCELAGQVLTPPRLARCSYGFIAPAAGICSFFQASVSGRDLPAAFQMARLGALLAAMLRLGGNPAEILRRVSEQWPNDGDIELRPQVLIGRIDLDTGHLSVASADHPPPVLVRADGTLQAIEFLPGPAIGMNDRSDWHAWHSTLAGGDCLVVPSSGLSGCRDRNDHSYARQGFPELLQRTAQLPIRGRMVAILDDVQRHCAQGTPAGDLALLLAALKERD